MATTVEGQNMEQCYENLIVIDIGANLTNKKYSRDLDSVIQRAKDAGMLYWCEFYNLHIYIHGVLRRPEDYGNWHLCKNK